MEASLEHDPEAMRAAFRAFNRWMLEDWGFDYQGRIFAAPYIPLCDVDWACEELEWAIANGAKMVSQTPGRVRGTAHGSPGDPIYDPFWARMAEAGMTLGIHSGDASYNAFGDQFGVGGTFRAFDFDPLRIALSASPIADKLAAMLCHGVFSRHPQLRVATVECGSEWVGGLLKRLKKVYGQMPMFMKHDPVEQFKRNVWVAPYYEDDLQRLKDDIGADHVLFGSDYPHAEGLAVPTDFINDCNGFTDAEIQLVMRDNAMGLLQPATI
jgi:predicted TIM-barrel fold metal-dependent hydrolase